MHSQVAVVCRLARAVLFEVEFQQQGGRRIIVDDKAFHFFVHLYLRYPSLVRSPLRIFTDCVLASSCITRSAHTAQGEGPLKGAGGSRVWSLRSVSINAANANGADYTSGSASFK